MSRRRVIREASICSNEVSLGFSDFGYESSSRLRDGTTGTPNLRLKGFYAKVVYLVGVNPDWLLMLLSWSNWESYSIT